MCGACRRAGRAQRPPRAARGQHADELGYQELSSTSRPAPRSRTRAAASSHFDSCSRRSSAHPGRAARLPRRRRARAGARADAAPRRRRRRRRGGFLRRRRARPRRPARVRRRRGRTARPPRSRACLPARARARGRLGAHPQRTARLMLGGAQDLGAVDFMRAEVGLGVFVARAGPNRVMLHQAANDGFRGVYAVVRRPRRDRGPGRLRAAREDGNRAMFMNCEIALALLRRAACAASTRRASRRHVRRQRRAGADRQPRAEELVFGVRAVSQSDRTQTARARPRAPRAHRAPRILSRAPPSASPVYIEPSARETCA